ncbi:MAG: YbaN family protein [Christensenellaceae bacterium]|jgi:uncharacterized membrane protein YbaN (DUF454 family)|nr:YbaN family protein [Christensenellaceae bacterium]
MKNRVKNIIFIVVGSISLALGIVGIILPILPTVPFFLLTIVCYARGSKRFYDKFTSSKIYKKKMEAFVKTRKMTVRGKIGVLLSVTLIISLPIIFVNVLAMRIVLACVILFHYIYIIFFIKTATKEQIHAELLEINAQNNATFENSEIPIDANETNQDCIETKSKLDENESNKDCIEMQSKLDGNETNHDDIKMLSNLDDMDLSN